MARYTIALYPGQGEGRVRSPVRVGERELSHGGGCGLLIL